MMGAGSADSQGSAIEVMPSGTRWTGKPKDEVIEILEARLGDAHRTANEKEAEIRALVETGLGIPGRRLEVLRKIGHLVGVDPIYLR